MFKIIQQLGKFVVKMYKREAMRVHNRADNLMINADITRGDGEALIRESKQLLAQAAGARVTALDIQHKAAKLEALF